MEGKKPERHPYLVMKEELKVLEKKLLDSETELESLKTEWGVKSPFQQGAIFNEFVSKSEKINAKIQELKEEIMEKDLKIKMLTEKMVKEN
ncbi:MAG: hypothetical protein KBD52_00185 [Candidatus Pacebacteria bacterium]|nr:hypothetical protein [Candidatus Paceibacterota bacterium]